MKEYEGTQNIHKQDEHYTIIRTIKDKQYYYGRYPTLIIALMVKDQLVVNGWKRPAHIHKYHRNKKRPPELKYITKRDENHYVVSRNSHIPHAPSYYGSYPTLIIALMMRDKFEANNWVCAYPTKKHGPKLPKYIHYIKPLNKFAIQKKINGHSERFGLFTNLEDAIKERDLLIKYDWDWDLLCNLS